MISQLKTQQEKLIINEKHEAWERLARKLAHEIKTPLTPIQLTIDRLKNIYSENPEQQSTPSIRDRVLRKRGLDGDNSCLKFIIFFPSIKKFFLNFILCNFLVRTLRYF